MTRFSTDGAASELLAMLAKEAPTIRFHFSMRPEVAAKKGTSIEGCNYARAIDLRNGEWIIIGLLESEAKAGELPPVFQVMCRDEEEMQLALDAILGRFLCGTIGELLD